MFIEIINLSSKTLKDTFVHLRGKLGDIQNQRRPTVDREIIL